VVEVCHFVLRYKLGKGPEPEEQNPYPPCWEQEEGFDGEALLFWMSMSNDAPWYLHVFAHAWEGSRDFKGALATANEVMAVYPIDPRNESDG